MTRRLSGDTRKFTLSDEMRRTVACMTLHSAIGVLLVMTLLSAAAFSATPEYEVKAAYIYNFAKFFEWPRNESASSFTVCIYGKDPFQGYLEDAARNKFVKDLPFVIRRLAEKNESWDECQMLFIGLTTVARTEAVLAHVQGRSIVTIGESDSFTEKGGMIGLVVDQGRVRFDINLAVITAAHLQVSSRLLALGRTVK